MNRTFYQICVLATGGLLAVGRSAADELTLADDARLSGEVRSITPEGAVELISPLSLEPMLLAAGAVKKVDFRSTNPAPEGHADVLELANGDRLRCRIESFDGEYMTAISPDIGRLRLSRQWVRMVEFETPQPRVLADGPELADWRSSGNWEADQGGLLVRGGGWVAREFPEARRFSVRFELKWSERPDFEFRACDSWDEEEADRYILSCDTHGVRLKRQHANGKVITLASLKHVEKANAVRVELRIDRETSTIELVIDDVLEGRYVDPSPAPKGNGMMLRSAGHQGHQQWFRQFVMKEWDGRPEKTPVRQQVRAATDRIFTQQGERFAGSLKVLEQRGGERRLLFHDEKEAVSLSFGENEVFRLYFGRSDEKEEAAPFLLRLRGEGLLQVRSCVFEGGEVRAQHPLLGEIVVGREGIATLETVASRTP